MSSAITPMLQSPKMNTAPRANSHALFQRQYPIVPMVKVNQIKAQGFIPQIYFQEP